MDKPFYIANPTSPKSSSKYEMNNKIIWMCLMKLKNESTDQRGQRLQKIIVYLKKWEGGPEMRMPTAKAKDFGFYIFLVYLRRKGDTY